VTSHSERFGSGGTRRARRAFHVLAKPAGPACNLSCSYCFYLDKKALYPGTQSFRMSEAVLERFIQQYIETQPAEVREIQFAWQGGEPTLMGLRFFERVVELQKRYARPSLTIENALQTNATLLDNDWGRFLRENGFLVGISIDGPAELHDAQRRDRRGRGSFDSVLRGLEVLKRNRVEFNTLTVLHRHNCSDPARLYDFLTEIGSKHLQFIPIVEHTGLLLGDEAKTALGDMVDGGGARVSARTITPEQWGRCLNGIFDRWLEADGVGNIFVQLFETMLGLLMGVPGSLCVHAEHCGRGLAIEHNGDVYSCDHFVSPEYELGNITDTALGDMVEGAKQRRFGRDKRDALPRYCRRCDHLRLCGGACPKDRIARTPDGEPRPRDARAGEDGHLPATGTPREPLPRSPATRGPRETTPRGRATSPSGDPRHCEDRPQRPLPLRIWAEVQEVLRYRDSLMKARSSA